MNVWLFRDPYPEALAALQAEFPACVFRVAADANALARDLDWPDAVFGNAPAGLIGRAPRVRWLQIVSSGFDDYCTLAHGPVTVTTAHGLHAPIVAQHVLTMILWFMRGQPHFAACQQAKTWDRKPAVPQASQELTIGLIGYGATGREIARLARPFGFRLIGVKKTAGAPEPNLDELLPWSQLDELLEASNHLVLTLPLTSETRCVLGRERIARLKPDAVVHNVARGELLDEAALAERLREGSLGGAALDVFAQEPLLPESPWWGLPNTVVTPHLAGHHRHLNRLLWDRFRSNLRRWLQAEPLSHLADFERGYGSIP